MKKILTHLLRKAEALKKATEEQGKNGTKLEELNNSTIIHGVASETNGVGVEKLYPIENNDNHVIELEDSTHAPFASKGPKDIVNSRI
jgi:hypothetical protein